MPSSEHVYCVAIAFKMTEQVEQQICINFVLSLNIPLWELFRWFRRPQLWATGDWQLHHDNMPAHASHLVQSFLAKHQTTQVTQPPYSPDLAPCDFWLFPKLKSPLKVNRFQTSMRFRKILQGSWWWLGELCEVPRCQLWRTLGHHWHMYSVSCILYLLQ